MTDLKEEIIDALREVYDPEIPINVYDLGLIYEITPEKNGDVHVLMTLTSPTCPTAEYLQESIKEATESVKGVKNVIVELTFEPAWSAERVSMEAKEELGLGGGEDLAVQQTFAHSHSSEVVEQALCFNCGASDEVYPILDCKYKGEKTKICTKCLEKFS